MAAIIEGLISNPTFDSRLNDYADHERAHANRMVAAYFKTKLQCPQLSQREICSKLGVSNNTLAKYKHALGQPFRRSTVTCEQKMEALSKALVTRRRNQEYRAFLSELSERGLSADETQSEIDSWRKAHGLGELSSGKKEWSAATGGRAAPEQGPVSDALSVGSEPRAPFVRASHKKRDGRVAELPAGGPRFSTRSFAFSEQQSDVESASLREGTPEAKADAAMRLLNERK